MRSLFINTILLYLRFLARLSLSFHKPIIIGIAGSVGKTSTKNAIEATLKDHATTKSIGNSETGIPLGILGITPKSFTPMNWLSMLITAPLGLNYLKDTRYLIAEMGIDDPLPPKNMTYLLTILQPDIAILLHESAAHTQQFEKSLSHDEKKLPDEKRLNVLIKKIASEDAKMGKKAKVVIYNADNIFISDEVKKLNNAKQISFGKDRKNTLAYDDYLINLEKSGFSFLHTEHGYKINLLFEKIILPLEYQSVFAAAISTAIYLGLTPDEIKQNIEKNFTLPKGRSSHLRGARGIDIIDSSYNASNDAVMAFLSLLKELKKQTKRKIVFVFGDMRELGREAKMEHEIIANECIGIVDYLYLVGPLTREYVLPVVQKNETAFKEIRWFDNAYRVGEFLEKQVPAESIVLFKGSQNTIYLEEAVKMMLLDKVDTNKLCRQSDFWLKTKEAFSKRKDL